MNDPGQARDVPTLRRPLVAFVLAGSLLVYAAIALAATRGWVSGLAAPAVAGLLWWSHRRARFSAYIFFSAVAGHGLVTRSWPSVLFAAAALALMQLPSARRAWPRLRPRSPVTRL